MTKEELKKMRFLNVEIESLLREKERIKNSISLASRTMDGTGSKPSGTGDPTALMAIKIIERTEELEREINLRIDELYDLKQSALHAINKLQDDRHRVLLQLRYFEGLSWEEIARKMHYSRRGVLYIHGDALRALRE